MRHARFVGDLKLQFAQAQAPTCQTGVPRTLNVQDPPQAVVVEAYEEAVTLEVGAEFERPSENRQALPLRDPVGKLVRSQPPAGVRDRLKLSIVFLLEQGGAHLRSACVHVEDVLPPASRECEDRRGRKGLLQRVERLMLQRRGGGHEERGRGRHEVRKGAATRAKLGTNRRKTLNIPTKLRTFVQVVAKCASRSTRACASIAPRRPGSISCPKYSTVVRKNRHLGRQRSARTASSCTDKRPRSSRWPSNPCPRARWRPAS